VKKDARRHRRIPYLGPVRLSWEDARGEPRFAHAKCVDVSEGGMRVEVPAPLKVGTRLSLNAERINISGAATVKHVQHHGARYIVGVALSTPAGEKTLAAALSEPWALRESARVV